MAKNAKKQVRFLHTKHSTKYLCLKKEKKISQDEHEDKNNASASKKKYVFRPPPPLIPPFLKNLKKYIILRTWPSQFHNSLFLMADGLYFESVSCCYVFKRISKKHFGIFFFGKISL